jgi:hypothetical protein
MRCPTALDKDDSSELYSTMGVCNFRAPPWCNLIGSESPDRGFLGAIFIALMVRLTLTVPNCKSRGRDPPRLY